LIFVESVEEMVLNATVNAVTAIVLPAKRIPTVTGVDPHLPANTSTIFIALQGTLQEMLKALVFPAKLISWTN